MKTIKQSLPMSLENIHFQEQTRHQRLFNFPFKHLKEFFKTLNI